MHPIRRQRAQLVVLGVLASTLAVGLVVYALRQNINYFYTPLQVIEGQAPKDVAVRIGGIVVQGSLQRSADSLEVRFDLSDGVGKLRVSYSGILPDLFDEGHAAIAAGFIDKQLVLQATQVLAKHDENYVPPEVAEGMKDAYQTMMIKARDEYGP